MIKQSAIGLDSRSLANIFDESGMLPLITAPMTCVVNDLTKDVFTDLKIQVCLPRNERMALTDKFYSSVSLEDFRKYYIDAHYGDSSWVKSNTYVKVCIDTANGNMPKLHKLIKEAKDLHGKHLIIIAGNVGSVDAFLALAQTGVDYIRVGIGGGSGCNTTKNTGVGQVSLDKLVNACYNHRQEYLQLLNKKWEGSPVDFGFASYYSEEELKANQNIARVKIVADGISTFIKQTIRNGTGLDNGYSAINQLLWSGADLVMIGSLFAQSIESAGKKYINESILDIIDNTKTPFESSEEYKTIQDALNDNNLYVDYYGMSTQKAQKEYKSNDVLRHSEGNQQFKPVKWSLTDWLIGSSSDSDYLPGYLNVLKSAMSYTGSPTLKEFHNNNYYDRD